MSLRIEILPPGKGSQRVAVAAPVNTVCASAPTTRSRSIASCCWWVRAGSSANTNAAPGSTWYDRRTL